MNRVLTLFFCSAIALAVLSACERDDICPPDIPTTPLLVVGFYDIQNQDELKAVPRLRVVGAGQNSTVPTFSDRTDQRTVNLPLKTNEQSTEFFFIRESASDSSGAETGNIDNIQFTYQTNQVFVSRGCGYAVNYSSLDAIQNPGQNDPDSWISALLVEQQQISNQDTVHVKIFH